MGQSTILLSNARRLQQKGDLASAERLYRQVLTGDPGHAQAALCLGRLLLERNEFDEAARWLATATDRRTSDAEALVLLGRCYFSLRRMADAHRAYERAMRADPSSRPARVGLARTLAATSQPDAAMSLLGPLLAGQPDPDVLEAAGHTCFAAGRNEEAAGYFHAAAELRPTAALLNDLGWASMGAAAWRMRCPDSTPR